jgi:hypothetical protein
LKGPFKEPLDVRKQRYRPFSPSLRVETDYESVEKARKQLKSDEWTLRLHDNMYAMKFSSFILFICLYYASDTFTLGLCFCAFVFFLWRTVYLRILC